MIEFEDCPCTGKNLVRLVHPAILAALAREPLHGYLVLERLAGEVMFRDHPPDPAGVYRVLKGMEQAGLLTGSWDFEGGGPARRRYEITDRGRACLRTWQGTIGGYLRALSALQESIREALRS